MLFKKSNQTSLYAHYCATKLRAFQSKDWSYLIWALLETVGKFRGGLKNQCFSIERRSAAQNATLRAAGCYFIYRIQSLIKHTQTALTHWQRFQCASLFLYQHSHAYCWLVCQCVCVLQYRSKVCAKHL